MIRDNNIPNLRVDNFIGRIVVASDFHVPFHDERAVQNLVDAVGERKPEYVIINGDLVDFYMLSKFSKGEGRNPLEEINMAKDILHTLHEASPTSKIVYIIGNHESRLEKYILDNAPAVASIVPDVFTLFELDKYNAIGAASITFNNNFVFKHGKLLGAKSGLSAAKEMENSYMSGATGHTHRLALYRARKAGRKFVWLETGCMCTMEPEYMIDPNWQQGYDLVLFHNSAELPKIIEVELGDEWGYDG